MTEQSGFHSHIAWTKERLDEMDVTLAVLERQAAEAQAAARAKADQLIADLRKRRDAFQQTMNRQLQAGEAAWLRDRAQLESQWDSFAAEVNRYFETFSKQGAAQRAVFGDLAAAQRKAWREAGEQLHDAAMGFLAERRAEIKRAVQQMKTDASKSDARLQKLMTAGNESWAALNAALTESRTAFDRAVQAAGDAFKRAAEHGAGHNPERQPPR